MSGFCKGFGCSPLLLCELLLYLPSNANIARGSPLWKLQEKRHCSSGENIKLRNWENDLRSWLFHQGVCLFLTSGENSQQNTVVGLGLCLTTWWYYSLTVKWELSPWSPEKPPNIFPPKIPSIPSPEHSQLQRDYIKSKTAQFFLSVTLSSCQSCDATLQKLLLANMSVHTMYKYSLHIQTVTKWSVVDGYMACEK